MNNYKNSSGMNNVTCALQILNKMRHIDKRTYDRVASLAFLPTVVDVSESILQKSHVASLKKDSEKIKNILMSIENHLVQNAGFNFILHNLPSYAVERDTNTIVPVGYANIKDTLSQFGTVDRLHITQGCAYVKFSQVSSSKNAHTFINNMMIGTNIIYTTVV
jgi:hypothetical protein